MADVSISYKGNEIASMNATGVKTLLTSSAFCEDDITVSYTKPSGGSTVTTVSFPARSIFDSLSSGIIAYVDGNNTPQTATALASGRTATSYQMLSKSILIWESTMDPVLGITGNFSGMSLAYSDTQSIGTETLYRRIYQID